MARVNNYHENINFNNFSDPKNLNWDLNKPISSLISIFNMLKSENLTQIIIIKSLDPWSTFAVRWIIKNT